MNPIPLNDRGQFRYTDLVGYIPEFLQEEPDVVDFLQVMSDYINDAYRNIEDVEEFEFKLCAREADIDRVAKVLTRLRTMFELASNRGERVYYLSVPRANVKSNAIFGKTTGYTPYYVDVGLTEVAEEIRSISSIDRKVAEMEDGDVVFVNYAVMNPTVTRAYYYSRETNSLILDPEWSSQDPFTNSANTGNRMISFLIDDISSIVKRYGGENSGNSYFEVLFTARVSDVQSASATEKVYFDVDRVDEAKDEVYIDYYGMEYVPGGKYHSTMEFYGAEGWAWKDGYPTGIFYLKDTSAMKLDTVGGNDGSYVSPPDPALDMRVERYALSANVENDQMAGVCRFRTSVAFPQNDNGRLYLMDKVTGNCIGEFTMLPSTYAEGEYVTTAYPVWMEGLDECNDKDRLYIMTIPLYLNRGIADSDTAAVRVNWQFIDGEYVQMDWNRATMQRIVQDSNSGRYVTAVGGPFEIDNDDVYDDGRRTSFYVPFAVYAALKEMFDQRNGTLELSCGGALWDCGNAYVVSIKGNMGSEARGLITLDSSVVIRDLPNTVTVQLYTDYNGAIHVTDDGECGYKTTANNASGLGDGTHLAIYNNSDTIGVTTINGYYYNKTAWVSLYLEDMPEPGWYDLIVGKIAPNDQGYVKGLQNITRSEGGWVTATCKYHDGDVFTDGIFRISDGTHTTYVRIGAGPDGESVEKFSVAHGQYLPGTTVYNEYDGQLYTCVSPYTPEVDSGAVNPATLPYFRLESTVRHRISYGSVRNRFMPFYGQVKSMEFGEKVDYSGDISVATRPLYITKVVENRLKYGWEHREFLNYGTLMDMTDRQRNGSIEVYSSAMSGDSSGFETDNDIVTASLDRMASWDIQYPVILRGTESVTSVDVDNPVYMLAEFTGDAWEVTVQSAGHGLVDGVVLRVAGFDKVNGLDINGYWPAKIVDGDRFTFSLPVTSTDPSAISVQIPVTDGCTIEYIGDYWSDVLRVSKITGFNEYSAVMPSDMVCVRSGDRLVLIDMDVDSGRKEGISSFDIETVSDGSDSDRSLRFRCMDIEIPSVQMSDNFQLRRTPHEGDYVKVGESIYIVRNGMWEQRDVHEVATPSRLYAKQNIVTISETNPEFALGDDLRIESIIPTGPDSATVRLKDQIPHFTGDNASIIENRTMVRIRNAVPGEYNGWHTVTEVYSPKAFAITVRLPAGAVVEATGVNGGEMYLNEGRWYSYTINSVSWDKISNRVTFSLDNTVKGATGSAAVTSAEHGLSVGDYVIVGDRDYIVSLDADNVLGTVGAISCYRVKSVQGPYTVTLVGLDGTAADIGSHVGQSIARGVLLTEREDDLGSLRGEYTLQLASIGWAFYRFRNGDIVVAAAQQNPSELKAWRVNGDGAWAPVRAKRSLKVSELDIDRYYNSEYDDAAVVDGLDYDKYTTYSDVDVAGDTGMKYVAGFRDVSRAKFSVPALSDMDTTRKAVAEYSSGEDYSNVAPRYNMKPGFRGVPAMKYPLAEKIERLCYLRDAYVIDFELIEYLARYLGYDITALGEDVNESSIYSTKAEREKAIRETIANLPQYYTLGGTKAGLHMLMAAFGVIGEALTLWTDADHPYQSMIYREEVVEKVEGGESGKWVPTPYIDLRITNNAKYPQFIARQSDIERIREQVRVFKPINVVFRDIMLQLVDTAYLTVSASLAGGGVFSNGGAVGADGEELVVEYSDSNLNNCAF